ncbi:MAG: translation initiation factor IF-2 subunit gamma [Candidatus Lokiarchaeota archaeon]|nr:translation initiation factor IF-2 subunit gamma [Candidatus Lokiarchaeota archaeon]
MSYDLENVSGIGKATADRLRDAGIDTVEKLALLKVEDLSNLKIKGMGESTALKYIKNAQILVKEKGSEIQLSIEKKPDEKESKKPKKSPPVKKQKPEMSKHFKELIKKQAECNIGLVGHVDHGKTTLVKALTGDWTDRHSEEQERGISIKLGYSNATILYCSECNEYLTYYMSEVARKKGQPRFNCPNCSKTLEFKRNISFVDAPGHEILMATMLSGASLMNGACLLISADEICPQPQTREHLEALNIASIKNIIIIQNKIDAVSKEQALENYKQIKEFVKDTIAQNAPIIPVSAVFGANLNLVVQAFEEIIKSPKFQEDEEFQFLVARSFDINRPGTQIYDLNGGVIGGSVLKGKVQVGEEIEIRPGLRVKNKYQPLRTKIVSISQGTNFLEEAKPGGLIGLGTMLDPALTRGDSLIGHLVGRPDTLPEIIFEVELQVNLLETVLGSEIQMKVQKLKHNEKLLLVVGTEKTAGTVLKILKNSYILSLNPPICAPVNSIFAISRILNRRYRLIGYGKELT